MNTKTVFWGITILTTVTFVLDFFANLYASRYPSVQSHGWDESAGILLGVWAYVAYKTFWS